MSHSDDILHEENAGVLSISFNRPQARNAFTFDMYETLERLMHEAASSSTVRVVVLSGVGEKAFAAGTDISQFRAFRTPEDALAYEARVSRVLDAIEQCRKPVIAAISGACTGGGAAIAAASDIRITARGARFGFPVARTLGNCLSMSNYARLVALIGPARTVELIFTAKLIDAEQALAMGFVSEVLDDATAVMARAHELAATIGANAPLTLQATKEAVRRLRVTLGQEQGKDLLLLCYMSQDFREGMEAFLQKRAPQWTGT